MATVETAGRPTKKEQIDIEQKLREYFEKGISATTTSQLTKLNIKTVCKYFDNWARQIRKINDVEFLKRIKTERENYLMVLDRQLLKLYNLQDEMNEYVIHPHESTWDGRVIQGSHYRERMNVVNMICQIMNKKFELLSDGKEIKDVSKN